MPVRWLLTVLIVATAVPAFGAGPRNHLRASDSPYLRLHAGDPVDWRTWSAATLTEAKRLDKPILLSIGYAACHWCHVMQRESFADRQTATLINALYLPILVDREERPDIDSLFQQAMVLMGRPSGWPLTVFLTPDGKPFWGSGYFPKQPPAGLPSFIEVLERVAEVHATQRQGIVADAAMVSQALARLSEPRPGAVTMQRVDAAAAFLALADRLAGGFGEAPKFPLTPALEALWRAHLRTQGQAGKGAYAEAVHQSLAYMGDGAFRDHVGGGFFRYTSDTIWRQPHFEKMLDVNAAMLGLLTEVWREGAAPLLERMAWRTAAFLIGELRLPGGAFASSLDADSLQADGTPGDGAYYLWDADAVRQVLGDDAAPFLEAYGIADMDKGPPGRGPLYRVRESAASPTDPQTARRLTAALARLDEARKRRPRPARDGKAIAHWNGLAIAALAEAGMAFDERQWVDAARRAFAFIVANLIRDGRLIHSWHAGRPGPAAVLDDLAAMAEAAITLFEATGEAAYLARATEWAGQAVKHHWDDGPPAPPAASSSRPTTPGPWWCACARPSTSPIPRARRRSSKP